MPEPTKPKKNKRLYIVLSIAVGVETTFLVVVLGWIWWNHGEVARVYELCGINAKGVKLSADEKSIEIKIDESDGDAATDNNFKAIACIRDETHVPSSVMFKFKNTRPIDGLQEESWDGLHFQWSMTTKSGNLLFSKK